MSPLKAGEAGSAIALIRAMGLNVSSDSINETRTTAQVHFLSGLKAFEGRLPPPNAKSVNAAVRATRGSLGLSLEVIGASVRHSSPRESLVDRFTINTLMADCADRGHARAAALLLVSMRGGSPAAGAIVAAGDLDRTDNEGDSAALATIQNFLHGTEEKSAVARISPDSISYNTAIKACGEASLWKQALSLLREMTGRSELVRLDEYSFSSAIRACERGGEWKAAVALFGAMSNVYGIAPSTSSLNSVVKACCGAGHLDKAVALVRNASAVVGKGGKARPDAATLNYLLHSCRMTEMPSRSAVAQQLFTEALDVWGVKPNVVSFASLIAALGDDWQSALEALDAMEKRGLKPNAYCVTAAIVACGRGGEVGRALSLLDEVQQSYGVAPTTIMCNAALSACERAGEWHLARGLRWDMQRGLRGLKGCYPDSYSYNTCAAAMARVGEFREALAVLDNQNGVASDDITIEARGPSADNVGDTWEKRVDAIGYTAAIKVRKGKSTVHLC